MLVGGVDCKGREVDAERVMGALPSYMYTHTPPSSPLSPPPLPPPTSPPPPGYKIEPGDVVFMSSYSLGRSEQLWGAQVLEYDPDRFGPARAASIHRFQWLPFGAGPRMCVAGGGVGDRIVNAEGGNSGQEEGDKFGSSGCWEMGRGYVVGGRRDLHATAVGTAAK